MEPDYANYLHRVGRTGRFGTDGVALTFMTNEVESEMMDKIAKFYQIEIKEIKTLDEFFVEYKQMRQYLFSSEALGV
jgi:superfamily II DNA/RNA helicase